MILKHPIPKCPNYVLVFIRLYSILLCPIPGSSSIQYQIHVYDSGISISVKTNSLIRLYLILIYFLLVFDQKEFYLTFRPKVTASEGVKTFWPILPFCHNLLSVAIFQPKICLYQPKYLFWPKVHISVVF